MKSIKPLSIVLFFASFALVGLLVISCTPKPEPASAPEVSVTPAAVPEPATPAQPSAISVDFDQAPLSDVAQFVTTITGQGLILNTPGQQAVTWIEYDIPLHQVWQSFVNVLSAYALTVRPTGQDAKAFTIQAAEEPTVSLRLDYATNSRTTFFLIGNTIYSQEEFPYELRREAGQWFAVLPQSIANRFGQ